MNIYNYDSETFEYLNSSVADEDPVDAGDFLIPAFATIVEPLSASADEVAVFDPSSNEWTLVPDFRGSEYWLADGSRHEINEVGVSLPQDALLAAPPQSLEDAKAEKLLQIDSEETLLVESGFDSDALGTTHRYSSDEKSQFNLVGSVVAAEDTNYKCADAAGESIYRFHTAAQIQQVLVDGKNVKLAAMEAAEIKRYQVGIAVSTAELDAIIISV